MLKQPKVSILILNWNGLQDTIECLESLKKITYPNYEVIVVDNGSKENDADVLEQKYANYIQLIRNKKNLGFAGGNNIAIRRVLNERKSDYILFLNNDTVVVSNFLTELVKILENDSKIGIVGPKIYFYEFKKRKDVIWFAGGRLIKCLGQPLHIGLKKIDKGQFNEKKSVGFISGCCLLIRRDLLQKIGGLDEDYFSYGEDLDLNIRVRELGYKIVYVPSAVIFHKASLSLGYKSPRYYYYSVRNRILLVRKRCSGLNFVLLFLPLFILLRFLCPIFKFTLRGKFEHVSQILKGTKDGLMKKIKSNKL